MSYIKALSFTTGVRDWLAHSRHPRILHLFDQVCNLINERGEVLSVVTPQIGDGPFNLVVENGICFSEHLNLDSPIRCAETAVSHRRAPSINRVKAPIFHARLHLGALTIDIAEAELWNPRPDWEKLHVKRGDILGQIMSLRAPTGAQESFSGEGIAPVHTCHLPRTNEMRGVSGWRQGRTLFAMTAITDSLSSALVSADLSSSIAAARQLAGLGIGLTPSGDDFILGAILATWFFHPPDIAKVLAEEIADSTAPLTTSLSAAWLRSAGRGEAGILWHEFFDALIAGDAIGIRSQIDKILSVGETSGADALSGYLGTYVRWGEMSSIDTL